PIRLSLAAARDLWQSAGLPRTGAGRQGRRRQAADAHRQPRLGSRAHRRAVRRARAAEIVEGAFMPDVKIAGATLHYEVTGTGAPILLIPGLGLDHTYYRFGIPRLAQRLQVFAVDPRGIGRSTKSPPYSVEGWADDFAELIDNLGF